MKPVRSLSAFLAVALLAAGCAAPAPDRPQAQAARPVAPLAIAGLQAVMGQTAGALVGRFGEAALDIREGAARKLQFVGPACVLDAYLYPGNSGGGEPVVTHVDARLPDGRDMDRASCVAALLAARQAR
jgi:hypothetical protein